MDSVQSSQRLVPWLHGVYRILRATTPITVNDPHESLAAARGGASMIFACRHGQLLPLLFAMEDIPLHVVVSNSADGSLLAGVLERRGFQLVRGSTSGHGRSAARGALRVLQEHGRIGVAVDGPRGPRGQVRDGILRIAQRSGVPIVPLRGEGGWTWTAPDSWDEFEVPLPGARRVVRVETPLTVPSTEDGFEHAGALLASRLGGWRAVASDVGTSRPRPSYGHL